MRTAFTELIGSRHPLQQAAMGGVAGPELAGAVAAAGALGMLCEFDVEPGAARMLAALELAGDGGVLGMGFFGHWVGGDLETFELAAHQLRVVEVFWSEPDAALVERARRSGQARVGWQVGSVEEARAAQDTGCDFVVAQGTEAGGHVRGVTTRADLLDAVVAQVTIPVVSAGGIGSAADVAAALSAGASAVRVGTRFVATTESTGHPDYIAALVAARSGADTVLTETFCLGWPDAPHRVLASAVRNAEKLDVDIVGELDTGHGPEPIARYSVVTPNRHVAGHVEAMALYAGMAVGQVTAVSSAADVVAELVALID